LLTAEGRRSDVSLVALPSPARVDEYDKASEELEALLRALPGIVAVYRTGSVSTPGISDLDRIAVIEKDSPVPPVWPRLSLRARYLAMHSPFLVDETTFRRHRWFAYLEPLELSSGRPVELEDRPIPEHSEPLLGAESLMVCLLRAVKQLAMGRLKVRATLCELNNVRHALRLARLGREDAPGAWRVADDVAILRQTWFGSDEDQRGDLMRDIATRTAPALLQALWALGERAGRAGKGSGRMRLGPPWSNVALVASNTLNTIPAPPRLRLTRVPSSRVSELRWRVTHPKIPTHPAVLELLGGSGRAEQSQFRSERDQLVRTYGEFLAASGRDYSGVGLAAPFLRS
jgi:hypothetical protein